MGFWTFVGFREFVEFVRSRGFELVGFEQGSGGVGVTAAEEVNVDEERVEVVEFCAAGESGGKGPDLFVGAGEFGGKSAEHAGHGEVGFGVGCSDGGVNEHGFAGGVDHDVAAPEVAVGEGRVGVGEDGGEFTLKAVPVGLQGGWKAAGVDGEAELGLDALADEEIGEGFEGLVGLRKASDKIVAMPAEVGLMLLVQAGEAVAQLAEGFGAG